MWRKSSLISKLWLWVEDLVITYLWKGVCIIFELSMMFVYQANSEFSEIFWKKITQIPTISLRPMPKFKIWGRSLKCERILDLKSILNLWKYRVSDISSPSLTNTFKFLNKHPNVSDSIEFHKFLMKVKNLVLSFGSLRSRRLCFISTMNLVFWTVQRIIFHALKFSIYSQQQWILNKQTMGSWVANRNVWKRSLNFQPKLFLQIHH